MPAQKEKLYFPDFENFSVFLDACGFTTLI